MSKLIIMVGLPGSGKSTIAKELNIDNNYTILSSDAYRAKILGDENDQSNGAKVFDILYSDMKSLLLADCNVIFDATNTSMKARRRIFAELDSIKKELEELNLEITTIAYVVPTPISECIKRDSRRNRTVGVDVIKKFYYSFQMPQKFEGFDEVVIHGFDKIKYNYDIINPLILFMVDFDQKNPHHIYTLDIHCNKLAENYNVDSPEYVAGKLHDLGKVYTQTFDDKNIAHYYSHDSVGTYEVLSHLKWLPKFTLDEVLYILFLINWHMKARDFKTPKAINKYKNLFGTKWYEALMDFKHYDEVASGTYDEHEKLKKIYG